MAIEERLYTADDLWKLSHLPEHADKRLELSEGQLIEMSPSGGEHGGVAGEFFLHIKLFVREHDLGYVTIAETGYVLYQNPSGRDIVRAPDVGFVAAARLPDGLPTRYIPLAPDLAVEVISPTDTAAEVQKKINEYLRYGTQIIWAAYPQIRTVVVHTPQGAQTLDDAAMLDGGAVLPGFTLAVAAVFPG